jgi:RNAse (barnase) inhibitor barstar
MSTNVDIEKLFATDSPDFLVVSGPWESIDGLGHQIQEISPGAAVKSIRCRRCPTDARLFQEFGAALQFPEYMGSGWDALDDCLSDFDYLFPGERVFLILTRCNLLLNDENERRATLWSILKDTAYSYRHGNAPGEYPPRDPQHVRTIVHVDSGVEADVLNQLRKAGITTEQVHTWDTTADVAEQRRTSDDEFFGRG